MMAMKTKILVLITCLVIVAGISYTGCFENENSNKEPNEETNGSPDINPTILKAFHVEGPTTNITVTDPLNIIENYSTEFSDNDYEKIKNIDGEYISTNETGSDNFYNLFMIDNIHNDSIVVLWNGYTDNEKKTSIHITFWDGDLWRQLPLKFYNQLENATQIYLLSSVNNLTCIMVNSPMRSLIYTDYIDFTENLSDLKYSNVNKLWEWINNSVVDSYTTIIEELYIIDGSAFVSINCPNGGKVYTDCIRILNEHHTPIDNIGIQAYNIKGSTAYISNMNHSIIINEFAIGFSYDQYNNISEKDYIYESTAYTYSSPSYNMSHQFEISNFDSDIIYLEWTGYVSGNAQILITNYVG
jgi:hypothetical protein